MMKKTMLKELACFTLQNRKQNLMEKAFVDREKNRKKQERVLRAKLGSRLNGYYDEK